MGAISLVTKGMLAPSGSVNIIQQSGSGGAGLVRRDEEQNKPVIKVTSFKMSEPRAQLTTESVKVKSVKMIIDKEE